MYKQSLLKWWLMLVLTASGCVIANYFNLIEFIWDNDMTKISFIIFAVFVTTSSVIGFKMFAYRKGRGNRLNLEAEWLTSEHLLSLGLLGTVISLCASFYLSFNDLDIGNVESAQTVIGHMATGLSSAMLTTICGLIFSMILKSQLVVAESLT